MQHKLRAQQLRFLLSMLIALAPLVGIKAQEQRMLEGVVVTQKGEPVIGVVVRDRDSKAQAVTDLDGIFKIAAATERLTLNFTYLGMRPTTWSGKATDACLVV